MSRVFEALTRAGEEKRGAPVKPGNGDWVLEEKRAAGEWAGVGEADGDGTSIVTALPVESWTKSWRERIEELLFGWDLRRYKSYPLVALEEESAAAEQYKILREQVKSIRSETGARCLALSSPVKEDGKTMVAVNLATALALDYEEQVLLIDGDLRSPQVHRYFGLEPSPGLTDYLNSKSNEDLMNYVQDTFLPNLRILPAGRPSQVSSELLAKEKMRNLMEEIRSRFPGHQIIVDSPPVLSTPDPSVLARQVDAVIMVIRAGKTPRTYLLEAVQSLNSNKVKGIVLNGAEMGFASKYYYYPHKD